MKNNLLTLFVLSALSFIPSSVMATNYTIFPDADVASYALPLSYIQQSYAGSITQQIYWAEELTDQGAAAGNINAITFYYTAAAGTTASAYSRNIQIYLMEVDNTTDVYSIAKPSSDWVSHFMYDNSTKKAGTKVYEGALSTQSVTASNPINLSTDVKSVTIPITAFPWNGSKNIVMTIADMTNTVVSGTNLRFLIASTQISSTSYPRFAYTKWTAANNERLDWIDDFSGDKYADKYGFTTTTYNTEDGQKSQRSYVNKVTFSIVTPVPVPTSPSAGSITASSATLSWTAAAGADSYEVRSGTTSGSLGAATNVGNVTSYSLSELTDETTYYYQIRTKKGSEYSAWTDESSFTTLAEAAHEHDDITFSKWASTTTMPTSGNYYLNDDVTFDIMSSDVTLAGNLNLCLNGHTANLYGSKIIVPSGKTLTIYDNVGGGKLTGFVASEVGISEDLVTSLIVVKGGGTLVLKQGTIENTYVRDADGNSYAIYSNGTVRISGDVLINSNDADIYLYSTNIITLDGAISNAEKHTVYKTGGAITSGWSTYMSSADPRDYFESANSARSVCLNEGEASLRLLLTLSESSLNSSISTSYNQLADVNLTRSLVSSQYNTFCLPFALDDDQLQEFFGAGYDLEEFVSSSLEDEVLSLTFNKVTSLEAGKPYLLQPSFDVANPSFEGVTIKATSPVDQEDDYISFHGTFSPTELTGGNRNLLFLGAGNELFWPASDGEIKAFRAYFEVKGDAQKAAKRARIVKKEEGATGMDQITNDKLPMTNKILRNGEILILRDGKTYNVLGIECK